MERALGTMLDLDNRDSQRASGEHERHAGGTEVRHLHCDRRPAPLELVAKDALDGADRQYLADQLLLRRKRQRVTTRVQPAL